MKIEITSVDAENNSATVVFEKPALNIGTGTKTESVTFTDTIEKITVLVQSEVQKRQNVINQLTTAISELNTELAKLA